MKIELDRTIQTLIDSGGDPWEYNSEDIQVLVNWIEEQQELKLLNLACVNDKSVCDCNNPKYVLNEVKQELLCRCGKSYLLAK
jgi:hypothetical protein